MTIITLMLVFIMYTIIHITMINLEHTDMQILQKTAIIKSLTRNCILTGILSFFAFLGISTFLADRAVKPVDKAWRQQKQFVADASHELKTPLTVILTNAELLQTSGYDAGHRSRFSDNILIMTKQMQRLTEELLELSKADSGSVKAIMNELDFSRLTETSTYYFDSLFFENGLELNTEIDNGITIKGSEEHLKQVVEILLENALKYAATPSQVTVQLKKQRFYCILSVSSHGDPISAENLKNIFKRFYRIDKSRSRTGSYGLGLSIAKSIVTDHHGKIWAESRDGVNTFFVRLRCVQI